MTQAWLNKTIWKTIQISYPTQITTWLKCSNLQMSMNLKLSKIINPERKWFRISIERNSSTTMELKKNMNRIFKTSKKHYKSNNKEANYINNNNYNKSSNISIRKYHKIKTQIALQSKKNHKHKHKREINNHQIDFSKNQRIQTIKKLFESHYSIKICFFNKIIKW